jgi:predicted nucleic acid-binding protein
MRDLLSSDFTYLEMRQSLFVLSAESYRALRKRGRTIGSPGGCLIAACAIEEQASLFENEHAETADLDQKSSEQRAKFLESTHDARALTE